MGPLPGRDPGDPLEVASLDDLDQLLAGSEAVPLVHGARAFFEEGGRRLFVVPTFNASPEAFAEGLAALDERPPDLLFLASNDLACPVDGEAIAAAAEWCERRLCFLIVDPDPSWASAADALAGLADLPTRSPNAALYFPALRRPAGGSSAGPLAQPPAGALAGLYARTDLDRGVWKAPAGTEASLAGEPAVPLGTADSAILNPRAINALRSFPGVGTVAWGARTLAGGVGSGSEWSYVAVRRMALFITKNLHEGTKWSVFEPNDEPLWRRLTQSVETFLDALFGQGAFQGTTPRDAYFVRVGTDTTPEAEIAQGRIDLLVGAALMYPAEFIVLRIPLTARPPA